MFLQQRLRMVLCTLAVFCFAVGCSARDISSTVQAFFEKDFQPAMASMKNQSVQTYVALPDIQGLPYGLTIPTTIEALTKARFASPDKAKKITIQSGANVKLSADAQFQTALKAAQKEPTEIQFAQGAYELNGTYKIPANTRIVGQSGAMIRRGSTVESPDLFVITDNAHTIEIRGIEFRNIRNYAVSIESGKNITIQECRFYGKSRIQIFDVNGLLIDKCEFEEPQGDECLAFIPNTGYSKNVMIRDTRFLSFSNEAVDLNSNCFNFVITGCEIDPKRKVQHHREEIIDIGGGKYNCGSMLIIGNRIDTSGESLASLFIKQGTQDVLVANNQFLSGSAWKPEGMQAEGGGDDLNYGVADIRVGSCKQVVIVGNEFLAKDNRRAHAALVLTGGEGNPYGGASYPQQTDITFANNRVEGYKLLTYSAPGSNAPRVGANSIFVKNNVLFPRADLALDKDTFLSLDRHASSKSSFSLLNMAPNFLVSKDSAVVPMVRNRIR